MSEATLQSLFEQGRLWRGQGNTLPQSALPTGFAALDAVLPGGGWPTSVLNEILIPTDGVGELQLLWPLLERLSTQGGRVVLVAPPYLPFAPAWAAAGIALPQLQVVRTDDDRNAMWVTEQCLRSAACAAVLCWPRQADQRVLRRLQLAAETGQCMGFAMRPSGVAAQPSMAAVRILIEVDPVRWRVLKCRGGNPPARVVAPQSEKPSPSPPFARVRVRSALPAEGGEEAMGEVLRLLSPSSEGRGSARQRRGDVAVRELETSARPEKPSPSPRFARVRSALRVEGEESPARAS